MEETPIVNAPVIEEKPEAVIPEEITPPAPKAGDRTDRNLLLKSLQEEREKRKLLEEKLALLESPVPSEEVFSDEGKILEKEISSLKSELSEVKTELTKKDLLIAYPILKEKATEFEEFRADPENAGMNLRTAAKAFLAENGLIDAPRRGLERPTGGTRVPLTSGMTVDDVKNLRETNYRRYQEMLMKGQIKIES